MDVITVKMAINIVIFLRSEIGVANGAYENANMFVVMRLTCKIIQYFQNLDILVAIRKLFYI